jgi:TonB family protein
VFKPNLNCATVFSSDAQGGDVTWPGDLKFTLCKNGHIELWMATSVYNRPAAPATVAKATAFHFGEWHAVGVSYGSKGQYIMVDGTVVASAAGRIQRLGGGGTHEGPVDVPTLGETVSHFFQPHQYSGGFEGIVARFRASTTQQDWRVAKGIDESTATPGGTSETTIPAGEQPDSQPVNPAITPTPASQNSSVTESPVPSSTRLKVSAREMSALKTFGAVPPYPPIARAARIEGTVLLNAIISDDGSVKNLTVISGPAMLQQSALDAVRTWRYKPYVVSGVPSEVEATVEVVFKLSD